MKISNREFNNIKKGNQVYLITNADSYENKDIILLECDDQTNEVEITLKYKFKTLDDCFKFIPFDLFGDFANADEAKEYHKGIKSLEA